MWRPIDRHGMREVMGKSNIPQNLWKYYIDAPKLWEETEVYDGMRSILMMNSYHNIVPWWMRNATLEDLVRLKLKFTSIVREREKYTRFAKEVMHNNNLDKKFVDIHTADLNFDLRNACEQLLTEVNTPTHRESINKDEETFRLHIKKFVSITEIDRLKLHNHITDCLDGYGTPSFPQLHSFTSDEVRRKAAVDVKPIYTHIKKAAEKPEVSAPLEKRNLKMFKCEECKQDFEREGNFNFHRDALCDDYYDNFCAVKDIETKFRCKICDTKFETERDLNEHEIAVWCDECLT